MNRKVTVVGGAGNVGATVARSIAERELADVVIIDIADYAAWLSPATARDAVSALLGGWDPSGWKAQRVSTHVNAVAHDDAACIAPLEGDAPRR